MDQAKTFEQILSDVEKETDPEKAKEIIATLSDEDKKKVSDAFVAKAIAARAEADTELGRVSGLKKERERIEGQNQSANKTFEQKLHDETVDEALNSVFKELKVDKEEQKNAIREMHEKLDDGSTRLANVIKNIRKAAVAVDPDFYIGAVQRVADLQAGAADYNGSMAGNIGGNGDGDNEDDQKFSKEAKELARKSGVTLEQAQKYIDEGGLQGNRRFELGGKHKKA